MSKRMQEYRNELNLIGNCNRKTQKALFQHAHGDFIRAIVDAIWTKLEGKLPLKPEQLSSVRKNKLTLRRIASKIKHSDNDDNFFASNVGETRLLIY